MSSHKLHSEKQEKDLIIGIKLTNSVQLQSDKQCILEGKQLFIRDADVVNI